MPKTRARQLYVYTEATYGVDPSTTGALYQSVPTLSLGDLGDDKALLETNYNNGENFPTPGIAGPDGGSFDFEIPLIGMATAAGNAVNASTVTDDWYDRLLTHIFGTRRTTPGVSVTAATTSTLTAAGGGFNYQDLTAVWVANIPAGAPRSQMALVTNAASPYTVAPNFVTSPGVSVAYGAKIYRVASDGGASLAFVYQDDDLEYTLLGARVTAYSESADARGIWRGKLTVSFDSKTLTTKSSASLPNPSPPAVTPLICTLSPVFFNGAAMETKSVTIDYGVSAAPLLSVAGLNGRADYLNISMMPKISVEPLRSDANMNLKRNATVGRLMVQQGAGVFAGGILNAKCVHSESVQASTVAYSDDQGRARQKIEFTVVNAGYFSAGAQSQKIQTARF